MIHSVSMMLFTGCAMVSLVGVVTTDDIGYLIAFYSFLILSGIEKICLKLEKNK